MLAMLAACGAGFLWGTGALIVNLLVASYGFTPENISFWRFFIGAVVLIGIFGKSINWRLVQSVFMRLVIAGIAMAGYVLCWFFGIEMMGAAIPTLIALCVPPILVTIIAVFRKQERVDRQLIVVLIAAIIGTALIVLQHGDSSAVADANKVIIGVLFSFLSAFLYAGFSMVSGRLSNVLGAGQSSACLTMIATVTMAIFGLFSPLQWPEAIPPQAWFLYLGVVTAAFALLAFSWGAAKLSPTALTVATLLEPLTTVVLAALIFGDQMNHLQLFGGGLLMFSICLLGHRTTSVQCH